MRVTVQEWYETGKGIVGSRMPELGSINFDLLYDYAHDWCYCGLALTFFLVSCLFLVVVRLLAGERGRSLCRFLQRLNYLLIGLAHCFMTYITWQYFSSKLSENPLTYQEIVYLLLAYKLLMMTHFSEMWFDILVHGNAVSLVNQIVEFFAWFAISKVFSHQHDLISETLILELLLIDSAYHAQRYLRSLWRGTVSSGFSSKLGVVECVTYCTLMGRAGVHKGLIIHNLFLGRVVAMYITIKFVTNIVSYAVYSNPEKPKQD
ncbi:hypothetical protein Pelo_3329 [Pelomyxa schiedti]|nr:hypothetical protein Pelo_3329 [Pelomyxa schiedti]